MYAIILPKIKNKSVCPKAKNEIFSCSFNEHVQKPYYTLKTHNKPLENLRLEKHPII